MKHLVLCLTALLGIVSGIQAQSNEELSDLLFHDLEVYRKHTLAMNFDSSLRFMPPKTFDLVPFDSRIWHMIEDKRTELGPAGAAQKQFFNSVVPEEVLKALENK